MSVITTVDEKLDKVKDDLDSIIRNLGDIVVYECYGYDDLSIKTHNFLFEKMKELIQLKKEFKENV